MYSKKNPKKPKNHSLCRLEIENKPKFCPSKMPQGAAAPSRDVLHVNRGRIAQNWDLGVWWDRNSQGWVRTRL